VRPLSIALAAAALCACSTPPKSRVSTAAPKRVVVFVTAEIKGQIEPCGCTSDPMGDLARTARLVRSARERGPVVVLDAGSLLYSEIPMRPQMRAQEQLKAELLVEAFAEPLAVAAVGLGPYDLAAGPKAVRPARQAANVVAADTGPPIEPPKIIEAGGVRIGVFGVVAPNLVASLGVQATDPVPAARKALAGLRQRNAEVIIALLHMPKEAARQLVQAISGIDFAVVGAGVPEPDRLSSKPEQVGRTWLIQPANRGQVVSRLDITVRGGGFADAIGEARAAQERAELDARMAALRADIERFSADPDADPAFVAEQRADLGRLQDLRDQLATTPVRVPKAGSWFLLSQVAIKKALPCDPAVQARKSAYDAAVGEANLAAATAADAPAVAEGKSGYAGGSECAFCHKAAVDFWKQTKHAGAWKTLVDLGKHNNLECVSCHVTGFDQPGGATLRSVVAPENETETLRDVQCEVCHGPASRHVDADGKETPRTLVLVPEQSRCETCHNALHSDTFQYEAYLRDVTGPGHGQAFRDRLGPGTTGHELRSAALEKAGAVIGEGCRK
jgi:hypothetical protein